MPGIASLSRLAVALAGVLLASGCTLKVAQGSPRPNIDLPESQAGLKLVLDESIRNDFELPNQSGINKTEVVQWRETLQRGFLNGFSGAFKTDTESPELTLQLMEATLEFVPTAVTAKGGAVAIEAQLRYKARLLDAKGTVVSRSTGTVASKRSTSRAAEVTLISESAVETLYERIAHDFFAPGTRSSGAD